MTDSRDEAWSPTRKTESLPGPKSLSAFKQARKIINAGTIDHLLASFVQDYKRDFLIVDLDGNEYVDCLSAWGAEPYGVAHPQVASAMLETWYAQGAQISLGVLSEPVIELAQRLVGLSPESITRAEFSVTGTQAVESAVRLMREATGRPIIIVLGPVYHGGSTTVTSAMSSDSAGISNHAAAFTTGIVHVPFPGMAHSPFSPGKQGNSTDTLHFLREWVLRYQLDPGVVAGVLVEPVSTEGGVICPDQEFWDGLSEICTEHDWVLAVDEVQTGMGRLGTKLAIDRWGVQPDLLLLGKGLSAGGFPIAAILGSERVMRKSTLSQGSTFGWQPAACAAALAGLDLLDSPSTLEHVALLERMAQELLQPLVENPNVLRVTAVGAEIAVEYYIDNWERTCEVTDTLHKNLLERGVLGMAESGRTFYRYQPPLLLPEHMWEYALTSLREELLLLLK